MNCPACGRGLPAGPNERCPFCAAPLSGPAEGALAPDLAPFGADPEGREEPLREIPGLKKREKTWKDEVRERVSHRRRKRAGGPELPLFPEGTKAPVESGVQDEGSDQDPPGEIATPDPARGDAETPRTADRMQLLDDELARLAEPAADLRIRSVEDGDGPRPAGHRPPAIELDEEPEPEEEDWSLGAPLEPGGEMAPVERPARMSERFLAGVVDVLVLSGLGATAFYFASRVARVAPSGLLPAWPYLCAYLVGLGVAYVLYFTPATGQTLGKMVTRLRVVDGAGHPPSHGRALLRGVSGALGVGLLGLGVIPILFDPARRALHDRITKTRVVKIG